MDEVVFPWLKIKVIAWYIQTFFSLVYTKKTCFFITNYRDAIQEIVAANVGLLDKGWE